MSGITRRLLVLAGVVVALALASPGTAAAHPLGRFTVNHYNGLTLHPDRLDVHAVVDSAEIPTFQARSQVDTDGNELISPAEGRAHATGQCDQLSRAVSATVDGEPLRFTVRSTSVGYPAGEAGLPTTRLVCELSAPAELERPTELTFTDGFGAGRIGWREITATGVGVSLPGSPVPARSISDELRAYPEDLLTDPLEVREVTLQAVPGVGSASPAAATLETGIGPLDRAVGWADRQFTGLVSADLTPVLGVLAVLVSLALGTAHALLPGHGKTLIAAYLAGRRGTTRDALIVGGTVTVTHTAGVLVVGLLLYTFASLLGEDIIGWLGLVSGLLVAGIGVALLRSALRARRAEVPVAEPVLVGADHGHGHGHGHGHAIATDGRLDRSTLFGMGVAAGLVPSPSALVVFLGAINFSRTWFGILLVLGYGLGMAGTLTVVGLLLVRLRDRLEHALARARSDERLARLAASLPVVTALLVLVVGLGLAVRGLTGTV
jgi:ABC-type nickel/cobalt efflux system permease component RcnA